VVDRLAEADHDLANEPDDDPWRAVDAMAIQEVLEAGFSPVTDLPLKSGCVLVPRETISLRSVLIQVVSRTEEEMEHARECLGDFGEEDLLARYLARESSWLVKCSTLSMVSSLWGLRAFAMGRRGYIYFNPGDDDLGEELNAFPILSGWEPVRSVKTFQACFHATYIRWWDDLALPPRMGQFAVGPSRLMRRAMFDILDREPDAWEQVCETLATATEEGALNFAALDRVAHTLHMPQVSIAKALERVLTIGPDGLSPGERRGLIAVFWQCIQHDPFPSRR
jgi:hypothetical protein